MNNSNVLYTVPTDMRSAAHACANWSAVNGWDNWHTCSNTISRTGVLRMFRPAMYSFNLTNAASYVFSPFTAV